jgi:hypothetical protein
MPVHATTGEVEVWNHWGMCDECKLFGKPAPVRHLRGGDHFEVPHLTVPRWLNPVCKEREDGGFDSWTQCNWCYAREHFGHEPNGSFPLAI